MELIMLFLAIPGTILAIFKISNIVHDIMYKQKK